MVCKEKQVQNKQREVQEKVTSLLFSVLAKKGKCDYSKITTISKV